MKHLLTTSAMIFFIAFATFAQDSETKSEIVIGKQTWSGENLQVTTFRNGDPVFQAKTEEEWVKAGEEGKPACIVYDFSDELGMLSGLLYNWYAVTDPRNLAPAGWHVPSDSEWTDLANFLGGPEAATQKLKSKEGWEEGSAGNDESKFGGLPGGSVDKDGIFDNFGYMGFWWSHSEKEGFGLNRNLSAENYAFEPAQGFKANGFSVRLVKDKQ